MAAPVEPPPWVREALQNRPRLLLAIGGKNTQLTKQRFFRSTINSPAQPNQTKPQQLPRLQSVGLFRLLSHEDITITPCTDLKFNARLIYLAGKSVPGKKEGAPFFFSREGAFLKSNCTQSSVYPIQIKSENVWCAHFLSSFVVWRKLWYIHSGILVYMRVFFLKKNIHPPLPTFPFFPSHLILLLICCSLFLTVVTCAQSFSSLLQTRR